MFKGEIVLFVIITIGAIVKLFSSKKYSLGIFLIMLQCVTIVNILLGGTGLYYYLLMELPVLYLCGIEILVDLESSKTINSKCFLNSMVLIGFIILFIQAFAVKDVINIKHSYEDYRSQMAELGANIPSDEKDQVFGYGVPAMWFLENDIEPPFRYFTMQEWMSKSDPTIMDKLNQYILNDKPKWIVLNSENINNELLKQQINDNYKKISENKSGYLYERK